MKEELRLTLVQTDIVWEDKAANLGRLRRLLEPLRGQTDIAVIPETFSTGFSMSTAELAEPTDGETLTTLRQWTKEFDMAIVGSFLCRDPYKSDKTYKPYQTYNNEGNYNRAFFLTPDSESYYYDKRHLFRMGYEPGHVTPGNSRTIVHYRGWRIMLQVCYDLRFPVWCRTVENDYDLLVCVANWPAARRRVWDILLQARALENISYVCGVNRIGTDGHGLPHDGGSAIYSPKGERLASVPDNQEGTATTTLLHSRVQEFRQKFPAWMDADRFEILP